MSAPANPSSASAIVSEAVQSKSDKPQVHALPILLRFAGFAPNEITRPAGDYFFAIGNLSGVKEVTFRLDREHGERLKEVNAKREKPLKQIVHLTPGTYLLTEANHPEWVCRITITPH